MNDTVDCLIVILCLALQVAMPTAIKQKTKSCSMDWFFNDLLVKSQYKKANLQYIQYIISLFNSEILAGGQQIAPCLTFIVQWVISCNMNHLPQRMFLKLGQGSGMNTHNQNGILHTSTLNKRTNDRAK